MLKAAQMIAALGPQWVLVKGGHLPGSPVDLLFDGDQVYPLSRPADRQPAHPRDRLHAGVGDRLVPGQGADMPGAVESAKAYVAGAIAGGFPLGAGIGPVDHGWRFRASGADRCRRLADSPDSTTRNRAVLAWREDDVSG